MTDMQKINDNDVTEADYEALADLDLSDGETKTESVSYSKPLEGEIILPAKSGKKIADNNAAFSQVASRIRERTAKGIVILVQNGRDLIEVKSKMGHGRFGDWLKREFGWTSRTAQNYMNATKAFDELKTLGCATAKITALPPTDLYKFEKLDEPERKEFADAIKSGDTPKLTNRAKEDASAARKNSSSVASKDQKEAEELSKIIAGALSKKVAMEITKHPGFNVAGFGQILQKEIAASFSAASSGGAA